MIRISNPMTSRVLLAFVYSAMIALPVSLLAVYVISVFGLPDPFSFIVDEDDYFRRVHIHCLAYSFLGVPFTMINVIKTSPSRLLIMEDRISAKFFRKTEEYLYTEIEDVEFIEGNNALFLSITVSGKKLKVEVEPGLLPRINKLIPLYLFEDSSGL